MVGFGNVEATVTSSADSLNFCKFSYRINATTRFTLLALLPIFATVAVGAAPTRPAVPADVLFEDWLLQDFGTIAGDWFTSADNADAEVEALAGVFSEIGAGASGLRSECNALVEQGIPGGDPRWRDLYTRACRKRRHIRLEPILAKTPQIVFTKHYNMGGSHYAYTEGLSDAQNERTFVPRAFLCLLHVDGAEGTVRTLLEDHRGVIRDPDVSFDGKRILFSWKKSDREDDYHLYEMEVATREVRQLTSGLGFADYEGIYLPGGDLLFSSTRCVQTVGCFLTEVSNLYTCDQDGRYLRRLGYDQVHTNYPQLLDDGRVIYTRWEYNDRGQIFPQPLFQMNPDGTSQSEFYGVNSWFPTTILHARGIPGTQKVVAVLSGHHCAQRGKLAIIDPAKGNQEAAGVQLIAPIRQTKAERVDWYGQDGDQFQYPYAISETEFLVTYSPENAGDRRFVWPFGIYLMTIDGRRELLAYDRTISCNQPVPLGPRRAKLVRPDQVDYREETGSFYVQDIYAGDGLRGVARGTIKALRVVGLDYRAAAIRRNYTFGPAGKSLASTPISLGNGTWDVKVVLGTATVHPDGSAWFTVPASRGVYFQALDAKGRAVQTMRSWSTLQPGETMACVGCHEPKNQTPLFDRKATVALGAGPEPLKPFYGPVRGFSFAREIQPILDRKCIGCHNDRVALWPEDDTRRQWIETGDLHSGDLHPAVVDDPNAVRAFSLLGALNREPRSGRLWSDGYLALVGAKMIETKHWETLQAVSGELVNWIGTQLGPSMLPPYYKGSTTSRLLGMLDEGHYDVVLSREEMEKLACWIDLVIPYCGDYHEANAWTKDEAAQYDHFLAKRRRMQQVERENIKALIATQSR